MTVVTMQNKTQNQKRNKNKRKQNRKKRNDEATCMHRVNERLSESLTGFDSICRKFSKEKNGDRMSKFNHGFQTTRRSGVLRVRSQSVNQSHVIL